ncbi:hypothetical protein MATL_G00251570 [Megalops atlanticus]|uniref:Rho-GAP domain-containing protein n=1 Tax=Megalops atlanticus TaxID=7932 RepID=A0A9D3SUB1_MEGAT|nr:hypothetical protein MATL_G00251570 [Megalops atlanticus]
MRRGRRKGASKDKVFGCDLLEHLAASSQEIPLVLRCCSEFIEEHGIVDGIYRLSGVSSNTQRLRNEFDSEGTPDLCKDVYLQDIHCVSSLCKAYFRELPNPLLTYQLYDKFADAVAVQLEEERLVKFKEVLKELPHLHFRTLEYLMHHLVRMAEHASQTNMHVRNLAIVWAPNLLRSRDIEATGFNGTAAFMEVRVQSIVVEFILTHVSQLFPGPGHASERRKSLPSPSVLCNQDDPFFRAIPFQFPSALSPGDGPPPMRPYHAIIEGTDKRKGSLKGRKWKSIFNLGGRLHDPRRKNKAPSKDKEKPVLRPAKSMDSLSSVPYSQEGSRHQPSPWHGRQGQREGWWAQQAAEEEPEYMDMRKNKPLSPTEDFHDLPLDFQDTFGFLDLIESSVSNQMNEFSVEPPCPHEEEEEEEEEEQGPTGHPADPRPCSPPSNPSCQAHRSLTFDPHGRACKSHSLPYKSRSFCPAPSSTSEDEDDDLDEDDGSDEEEDMLFYSLPSSLRFGDLKETDAPHGHSDRTDLEPAAQYEDISTDTDITNSITTISINTDTADQSERQPEDRLRLETVPLETEGHSGGGGGDCLQQEERIEEQETCTLTASERDHTAAQAHIHTLRDAEEEAGLAGSEEEEEEEDVCGVKALSRSDSGEGDLAAAHSCSECPLLRTAHASPASEHGVNGAELTAEVPERSETTEAPSEPQEGSDHPPSSPALLPEPCKMPSANCEQCDIHTEQAEGTGEQEPDSGYTTAAQALRIA